MQISVVVPCFNHEQFVSDCLRSIDEQDVEDLELVVIDDGSRDATWDEIRRFPFREGRRVRAFRTPNRGAHAALNSGLKLATGRYVALCNSDDRFAPNRLGRMVHTLESQNAAFAFSGVRYIDPSGRDVSGEWPYAKDLVQKQSEIREFPSVGFACVLTNVAISTGNFVFRRDLVERVGYFRPYRYVHDWDFLLRALLVSEPVYVPERLYDYRLHPKNSFLSLAEDAGRECPELMRRFLKAASAAQPANRLAPSPTNWPAFFDTFLEENRYQPYLAGWETIDQPYFPWKEELPRETEVFERGVHARKTA